MTKLLLVAVSTLSFLVFVSSSVAQCVDEPSLDSTKVLLTKKIRLKNPAEISGSLVAYASASSWREKGAEAAVVSIFVDGKYNQDLFLFAGSAKTNGKYFSYEIFVGELSKGEHRIELFKNDKRSATKAGNVTLEDLTLTTSDFKTNAFHSESSDMKRLWAQRNAPFIYTRPDAVDKFTDIPLVSYYELFDDPEGIIRIRYTAIFTNEDGGTQSKALMARWGRMTDIEWIYEVSLDKNGTVVSNTYQGANHQTVEFKGRREFGHPLLYTVTVNNNFADKGCATLRAGLEPTGVDLSKRSRESVMEDFPWTYRIMAEEMIREGRISRNSIDPAIVEDPRDYLYVEVYNDPHSATIALDVTAADGKRYSSDLGFPSLRVNRPGFVRIAVYVPRDVNSEARNAISVRCYPIADSGGQCKDLRVVKTVRLSQDYVPIERSFQLAAKSVEALGLPTTFVLQ